MKSSPKSLVAEKWIINTAQVLHALRGVDFRLDDELIRDVLARTVGEKWKAKK
jgi:hypothetical protein